MGEKLGAAFYTVELSDRGRIVLPAAIRHHLSIDKGDKFVVKLEKDGSLHFTALRANISAARGVLKKFSGRRKLVDEMIKERRAAASRE